MSTVSTRDSIIIDGKVFRHGDRISCRIDGVEVKDARISLEEGCGSNSFYICQNSNKGANCKDLLGYKHSWIITDLDHPEGEAVSDIKAYDEVNNEYSIY